MQERKHIPLALIQIKEFKNNDISYVVGPNDPAVAEVTDSLDEFYGNLDEDEEGNSMKNFVPIPQ